MAATWKGVRQPWKPFGTAILDGVIHSGRLRVALFLVLALSALAALTAWVALARLAPIGGTTADGALTPGQVLPALRKTATGPNGVSLELTYAPAVFFQVTGQQAPARPGPVFFLQEDTHTDALEAQPPRFYLVLDGLGEHYPVEGTVLQDSGHHRTSRFVFSQPGLPEARRNITAVVLNPDGSRSTMQWDLPLQLGAAGQPGAAPIEAGDGVRLASLNAVLRKVSQPMSYGGVKGAEVAATFATPEYFRAALSPEAARLAPDRHAVFLISETTHSGDLPAALPPLTLHYQGQAYEPDMAQPTVSSAHHRVTMVRFPIDPYQTRMLGSMELRLPDGSAMKWSLPVSYQGRSGPAGLSPLGVTGASILSLVGGMIAAMWPCLFQLTAFFIPALAGLSMQEASGNVGIGSRLRVVKAALFFILGFTIVYTTAGGLIGFAVQQFGSAPDFDRWQRVIGIVAGIAIIVLALRTAAKVRAPLVCKMPVLSRMAQGPKASGPLELMIAGLAFATGCMTCFGAALIIAMVVYVGMAGSALVGALTLFLFSMGMGIPLVIAAVAMARVLPLLGRLERITPWLGLASSAVMVGFAIMLITGNYMAFMTWLMDHL